MRILVCGSRDWTDATAVQAALRLAIGDTPVSDVTVVTGGCRGAERLATMAALEMGAQTEVYEANLEQLGRSAGPRRNEDMIRLGADLVLAFGDGRGTADLVRRATKAGIPVVEMSETSKLEITI